MNCIFMVYCLYRGSGRAAMAHREY